jgi:hypothetical protein
MKVIAFAGLARAGKTTAANILAEIYTKNGHDVRIMSFAEPMKRAAKRIGLDKDKDPIKYRDTLQRWGSTRRDPAFRPGVSGPHYWADRVLAELIEMKIEEKHNYMMYDCADAATLFRDKVVIFDDCRYPNEVEMIASINGITVFVDGISRITDPLAEWRHHESEQMAWQYTFGLIPDEMFDYYMVNDGDVNDLRSKLNRHSMTWFEEMIT